MTCRTLLRFQSLLFVALWTIGLAATSQAQGPGQGQGWQPPDSQVFDAEGTVQAVSPNAIQVLTKDAGVWWVQVVPRQSDLKITGTAEPGFLQNGLFVKFSGEIDAKGVLQSELTELEIFTPSGKNSSGVFAVGAEENAKPLTKLEPGTYDIRGRVAVFKEGEIQVVAGKKITGKVASDAKINVNVQDLAFIQKDDPMKVKGWYYERFAPNVQQGRPGQAMGKEIEIAIANPLTAPVKKGKPAKQPRGKRQDAPPAANADDPFGFNKAAEEKK